ncbi:MAG: transposase zinc-binding domain-containing protein [Pirellulaceae bacterium]
MDVLRSYTPSLLKRVRLAYQAKNVLSRILLCRTATLKGRRYKCPECHSECNVYNSCVDRHCPQCGGARRADWLEKTEQLILPEINYFQVVFTLPDQLSGLILGNRGLLYDLLFRAAWRALDETLRDIGQFQPAAQLVLHT